MAAQIIPGQVGDRVLGPFMPLDGLVVLFGPNSGGKTTVLEAVGELLDSGPHLRRDPGDDGGDPYAMGSLWFDLPGTNLPNSEDHRIMRDLLSGKYFADGHLIRQLGNLSESQIDVLDGH